MYVGISHIALILRHVHGMLNIRWHKHLVVHRLALFLLELLLVLFLQVTKNSVASRS